MFVGFAGDLIKRLSEHWVVLVRLVFMLSFGCWFRYSVRCVIVTVLCYLGLCFDLLFRNSGGVVVFSFKKLSECLVPYVYVYVLPLAFFILCRLLFTVPYIYGERPWCFMNFVIWPHQLMFRVLMLVSYFRVWLVSIQNDLIHFGNLYHNFLNSSGSVTLAFVYIGTVWVRMLYTTSALNDK